MKKSLSIIIILTLFFGLAGCWDMEDVEEKTIITTIIIDKTDDGFAFFIEFPDSGAADQQGEQNSPKKNAFVEAKGATLDDVRKDFDRKINKSIFTGAVLCVMFTERMARYSIEEYIYRMRQDANFRKTLNIFILKSDPMEFLEKGPKKAPLVGMEVNGKLETLLKDGQAIKINALDILEGLSCDCKGFLIPAMALIEDDITLTGYSIFDMGCEIGFIPWEEADGILIMNGKKYRSTHVVPLDDTIFTVDVERIKKEYRTTYDNGRIDYEINIGFKAEFLYANKRISITEKILKQAEQRLNEILKGFIENEIHRAAAILSRDYLFFFDNFRIKYPVVYRDLDWAEAFPAINFKVNVAVKLKNNTRIQYREEDVRE